MDGQTPLPPVLRAALYRRAVACAWLTLCERQHRYPHLTLDPLKAAPSLSFLGLAVMDELCARHLTSPVLH
ncbi:DUF5375 family protein [Klebsiella pneumoniae]|uniref:DUF5375 family protein n=1 Tax=Klebsiella pneumoniae TaxID=573 RepID=UPI00287B7EDE|nr:DUF5375 family protein [Klebsiella pneumoniae]